MDAVVNEQNDWFKSSPASPALTSYAKQSWFPWIFRQSWSRAYFLRELTTKLDWIQFRFNRNKLDYLVYNVIYMKNSNLQSTEKRSPMVNFGQFSPKNPVIRLENQNFEQVNW